MDWREYIHSDAKVVLGKPVIKGIRLSVGFLLGLFAVGWTEKHILDDYPTLRPQSLRGLREPKTERAPTFLFLDKVRRSYLCR